MLIICKESFGNQITINNIYIVVELTIRFNDKALFFRIIDNDGYPALYEYEKFEFISTNYINSAIILNRRKLTMTHKYISESSLNEKNIEGFWGCFIEGDSEALKIVQNIVHEISLEEHIKEPKVCN